jgi:competence ComEA-like helix-hairpin-helix protein
MKLALCILAMAAMAGIGSSGDLEGWIEDAERPDEVQLRIDELQVNPLDLNTASESEIARLPFFDAEAAEALIDYREKRGGFQSWEDLESWVGLGDQQREVLRRCTRVQKPKQVNAVADVRLSAGRPLQQNSWWLTQRAGFSQNDRVNGYVYLQHGADRAELFHRSAAGLELRDERLHSRLLLGDYQYEAGSGLVYSSASSSSGWLRGGGAARPTEAEGGSLRPAANRRFLFRGLLYTVAPGPVSVAVLAGVSPRDAAVDSSGRADLREGESGSSVPLDQAHENRLEERTAGGSASLTMHGVSLGFTVYHASWTRPVLYSGKNDSTTSDATAVSVFLRARRGAVAIQTEVARSDPGGLAHQTMISYRAGPQALALYHAYAAADYFAAHSALWGGYSDAAQNERTTGLRIQTRGRTYRVTIQAESSRTPFRTQQSPLRISFESYESRVTLWPRPSLQLDVLVARSRRDLSGFAADGGSARISRGRLQAAFHSRLDYEVRFEIRAADSDNQPGRAMGTLAYLQVQYDGGGFLVTPRLTVFHFDRSDVAMQPYERGFYGHSPVIALAGSGRRVSLLINRQWSGFQAGWQLSHTHSEQGGRRAESLDTALQFIYHR